MGSAYLYPTQAKRRLEWATRHFCKQSAPMIDAGKWVGGVEYKAEFKDMRFCPTYTKYRMVGAFKKLALKSWRKPCGAGN